jgi:hypothetical protein
VLISRANLLDDDSTSALEREPIVNVSSAAVVLDAWQSARAADDDDVLVVLVTRRLPSDGSCCARCVASSAAGSILFASSSVRRTSEITAECRFDRAAVAAASSGTTVSLQRKDAAVLSSVARLDARPQHQSTAGRRWRFCVCTQTKNRNRFLREWIAHNILIGVEAFFFYRNGGERLDDALLPLIADGVPISVVYWPHVRAQRQAFAHCLARMRDVCEWALFVDVDEFVAPRGTATLRTIVDRSPDFDAFEFPARVFSANESTVADGDRYLVIASSTSFFVPATQVSAKKTMLRTSAAKLGNNVHVFDLLTTRVCGPTCAGAHAMLHHYRFVSYSLFLRRVLDGAAGDVGLARVPRVLSELRPSESFVREATAASGRFQESDSRLLRFVPEIRRRLDVWREQSKRLLAAPERARHSEADLVRATLTRGEVEAMRSNASFWTALVAQRRHFNRVAPDGTPLAVFLLPPDQA